MRDKIFAFILMFFMGLGLNAILGNQLEVSSLERRFLTRNEDLHNTNIIDLSFQENLEDLINDQFYFRNHLLQGYYYTKMKLYSPFLSGMLKIKEDVVYLPDYDIYIKNLPEKSKDLESLVSGRGYNINELSTHFPDLKVYVYQPIRLEETNLLDYLGKESYGYEYRNLFVKHLGENVKYNHLEINSIEDYQKYYFKTDLHWNIEGAYQGYQDIINMIKQDFNINSPRTINKKYCFPQKFYGNLSNSVGQVTVFDNICDLHLDEMPEYVLKVNSNIVEEYKKDLYARGYKEDAYSDYDYYFGSNEYERIYEFNDETKPNVLMFVDSFSNPIRTWVASHFNKTVLLDLRSQDMPEDFNLINIIEEHDIDAVIICMYYSNLYMNGDNFIPME